MRRLSTPARTSFWGPVVAAVTVALLLTAGGILVWAGGGSLALRLTCPAQVCPSEQQGALLQQPPPLTKGQLDAESGQQAPDEQQLAQNGSLDSAGAAEGGGNSGSGSSALTRLLCGGPHAIPPPSQSLQAATHAILAGLESSFAPWVDGGFTLEDVMLTAETLGAKGTHDTLVWVEVKEGVVTFPRRHNSECSWSCNDWVLRLKKAWERGIREGQLRVPEGVPFLWNVYDFPVCDNTDRQPGDRSCFSPVMSFIGRQSARDVAVPPFGREFEPVFAPWIEKSDLAFFRGMPFCSKHGLNGTVFQPDTNCSRESLTLLSQRHPHSLNVSLVIPFGRVTTPEGPLATHVEHGDYKYLLQLDGITASRRLATLLSINSLVLKQESLWKEWYHPALVPCEHYLPFWQESEEDVLDLLRMLRGNPANQLIAQRIAANGQTLAAAWLDNDGQYRYWQMVIDRYLQLYRGSTNPATLKAKAWAEVLGREATAAADAAQRKCEAAREAACWTVGRNAANSRYVQLKEEAERGRSKEERQHPATQA